MPASRAARPIPIAIIGAGKIARDQHVPALAADSAFQLVAAVDPYAGLDGVPGFASLAALFADGPRVEAVAICTPPSARYAIAREALAAGKAVMLEKPPCANIGEAERLVEQAKAAGAALFAAWHSRFAPAVAPARAWLEGRGIGHVEIVWREDVRRWHPGQDWIFDADGLGVFDPGINALSIATAILPAFDLAGAELAIPENRQAPIAARLDFAFHGGGAMSADFDFRQTGPQTWDIRVEADDGGQLALSLGGAALCLDGKAVALAPSREYPALYEHFAGLIAEGRAEVDLAPLRCVAEAFMIGRRTRAPSFEF
jgi:D-galactose 1-dehydrogenase